jgi:uncharacterized protein YcnI
MFMTVISRPLFTRPASATSRVARAAAVGALVAAVVVGTAITASAHMSVHPDLTTAGQSAQLTFRVPDESDTANTIRRVVTLPQDRPFTDVSTQPTTDWTATVTDAPLPKPVNVGGATITKAPHTVTWTAQPRTKIAPGEYQSFSFATDALPPAGEMVLPAAGEMVLPVAQYYSDGPAANWTEPTAPGKAEPEHPAPVFTVTAATGATEAPAASTQASGTRTPAATTTTDNTTLVLGGVALAAVVAGALVLLRRRPTTDVK